MAYDLSEISAGRIMRAPRIILLGVEKIGKSTFAAGANNPVFLPIKGEEGIDEIDVAKTPVCNSVNDVFGWLKTTRDQENDWKTVVIDSASTLEALIEEGLCERAGVKSLSDVDGGFGRGREQALSTWRSITAWLDSIRARLNMTSILIGHVKVGRFDDPEGESYDRYQWDVHEKTANLLYRWADCILFANTKVVVRHEKLGFHKDNVKKTGIEIAPGSRFLFTQKRPSHPGGGRGVYGHLPYELPLSWEAFQNAVVAAM